ncbi:MAG: DUF3592 domain-containing protein [Terriglobales bacterium]|jgi:hypothetical protein
MLSRVLLCPVLRDLYDKISTLWSWRWPETTGEVTAVDIERIRDPEGGETLRLAVAYKFSIGDDGPYTGESFWQPFLPQILTDRVLTARNNVQVHQQVLVRYRADDPSVNKLDRCVWRNL